MDNKPPCLCGHSYAAHTWGTSFCSQYSDVVAKPELCGCKKYREGLCLCGHAWEVHGIGPDCLNCPVCGQECKDWRAVDTGKKMYQDLAEFCTCGHTRGWHDDYWKNCRGLDCTCNVFLSQKAKMNYKLACGKCVYKQVTDFEIEHASDCPVLPGAIEASSSNETRSPVSNSPTLQQWQKELEEEERLKPDCVCGHGWNSHYDENDKLPCAECWEGDATDAWDTSCKNYEPTKQLEFSNDPAEVNRQALKQIGDTGKMSNEEINRKIDEWKAKFNIQNQVKDANTSGTSTGQKAPMGGVYSSSGQYQGDWHYAKCSHKPTHVIDGKSWGVWAGTKSDCLPYIYGHDIILNVSNGLDMIPKHQIPFKWAQKYEVCHTKEIILDWPDGSIPVIPHIFWKDLKNHLSSAKAKMLVCCIGGHGRTGTAIACLLIACGYSAADAKSYIWRHYCKESIETKVQEDYIDLVDKALNPPKPRKKKAVTNGESK
jgi:hypothetical protein